MQRGYEGSCLQKGHFLPFLSLLTSFPKNSKNSEPVNIEPVTNTILDPLYSEALLLNVVTIQKALLS